MLLPGHISSPHPAPTAWHCHQADATGNLQAADKPISPQPTIPQSCSDPVRQTNPSSSKEKGVFQKQWSSDLTTGRCCLSPRDSFGSAGTRGCSSSTALPRGLACGTMGLSQLGGWRKPGASKHHAGLPCKAAGMQQAANMTAGTDRHRCSPALWDAQQGQHRSHCTSRSLGKEAGSGGHW